MPTETETGPLTQCLICQKMPTIKAHLLPEAFVRQIFHYPKADEQHVIHHPDTGQKVQSGTGRFDRAILCAKCDNVLGRYEDSAFRLINRLRTVPIGTKCGTENLVKTGTYPFRVPVVNEFIRFACGVLWKYASTPLESPGHIDIGNCKALFENICFHGADIPESVDALIERDLFSFAAFKDPSQVYYYCTPSVGRRGERAPKRMAWFSVGGFTIYLKLDEPGLPDYAPKKCWMRGRKQCFFNATMRSLFVNQGIHSSIGLTHDDLARLNRSLKKK
ncbi:MAG TPA: hypothetical protein VGN79_13765 [Devosia sp.]|jgi:hypothetical protein|nr:hypothetical protein [Devosia sp.]